MKSSKEILFDRVNIRCAMWAAGVITEKELDHRIKNCETVAQVLEDGQAREIHIFSITYEGAQKAVKHLEQSNKKLIGEHFANEIL